MSKILIIKSYEDALNIYNREDTVTPQNFPDILRVIQTNKDVQARPNAVNTKTGQSLWANPQVIPVKKPSQINLEQATEDELEDRITDWHEGQDALTRQRKEMMEAENQVKQRHENEDFLNWLQNPKTTLKAEGPPIFNPERHEDLTSLRWLAPRHIGTFEKPQPLTFGGRGSTGWWEDMIDSVGGEPLPGYKEGYFDQTTGTWVSPADIQALINPDLSQNIGPSGKMHLLGYPGYKGIPNYHRISSKGGNEDIRLPEGFQFGGYNRDDITEVKLPEGVKTPLEFRQLLNQAEIYKPAHMRRDRSTERDALKRVEDWSGSIGIPNINTSWDKKTPATFQELSDAGHFKVASEDEAKIDALSILKEIVDINHNEELDDNFKDDIMTLDRNHSMTRNQDGTTIDNVTPEMKNVIELMASNYKKDEPEPKDKEKSPFFA